MQTDDQLEEALSRPTEADLAAVRELGDELLILGVSGKMGPSMARLALRAAQQAGVSLRVRGAARFSDPAARQELEAMGVETIACDLLDPDAVQALPDSRNVLYMVGQKFGTSVNQGPTWAANTAAPAFAAARFRTSRMVAFSSGNVYPLAPVGSRGPVESAATSPIGEYAWSALGRERILSYSSDRYGFPLTILRLNYAIDLRYGVLRDIADQVFEERPIDLSMGYANVIWQRDANSVALRSFAHAATPPFVLNLTGVETIRVRDVAERFGELLGKAPRFTGSEAPTALLSDATLCDTMFSAETVTLDWMIEQVAGWIQAGGATLGKPTHFEQRDGKF
ncbi:MAG: NAD-dependent epimerase/dehydratase family protein [Acidobacteria bacterium]|nr:NAD-dependent epimerase/dehydratase family protein [Acidobacteriota bacterium]